MRIEAKNLVKIYGDRTVVNDVSFFVDKGGNRLYKNNRN